MSEIGRQLSGKQIVMITIDGQAKIVPIAKININTPYYKGEIEAMVPKSLICDLVFGNIPGVLDKPDPNWTKHQEPKASIQESKVAAVMTRAQAKKAEQQINALNVPTPSCNAEINVDSLKRAQKEDTSLNKLWSHALINKELMTKGGHKFRMKTAKVSYLNRREVQT
jgi:hypothetical protein